MKCVRHPEVETNLRCGKCGTLICPRCLVQTPVGARCPDCAQLRRHVIYQVSAPYYARATAMGLGSGLLSGLIWSLIPLGGFFLFLVAGAIGYLLGELISLSVNRKRGIGLQAIAGTSVLLSYAFMNFFYWYVLRGYLHGMLFWGFLDIYGLIALALGVFLAVNRLR